MPKLTNHIFMHEAEDGERHWFDSEVFVNQKGEFSCTVPNELVQSLEKVKKLGEGSGRLKVKSRAYSPSLNELKAFVQRAMADFHAVTSHSELVIGYSWFAEVSYFLRPDGSICENGSAPGAEYDKGGRWAESRKREGSPIHATSAVDHFSVGLYAAVYRKTTFTRPSGTSEKYERVNDRCPELADYPWAKRLTGFCGLSVSKKADRLEHMPLSEEAARFFFEAMLAMCEMGRRFDNFFNDKEAVTKAIAGTGPSLLTYKEA